MYKRYTWLIALALLFPFLGFSEGTRELRPNSSVHGELNPWDWGGEFATYDAPVDRRLNVHIKDHSVEKVFLGFQSLYTGKTYLRIKDPNGATVYGPVELKKWGTNPGFIFNYAAAIAGPNKLNPLNGYVPIRFDPTMNGDYVIELNPDSVNTKVIKNVRYAFFDVTVVDTVAMAERKGRLWSKLWALTTAAPANQFSATMYVLRDDSIRFSVNYNGIKPHGFGIVSNSNGVTDTGNPLEDRKSSAPSYTQGNVVFEPEHKIFLNPPDTTVYPFPKVLPVISLPNSEYDMITGCITTGYCFNLQANKGGTAEIFLSLDGIPGYQPGGKDRIIFGSVEPGSNCIYWDGYDGLGDTALTAEVQINYKYEAGLIHIPIYDAEEHPNGYIFRLIDNASALDTLPLFWDDTDLGGTLQDTGCSASLSTSCRSWITNYGNERFMNTWSFAYDQEVVFSAVAFQFCPPDAVDDNLTIDQGDTLVFPPMGNDVSYQSGFDLGSFTLIDSALYGTVAYDSITGQLTYMAPPSFHGVDSLRYTICDGGSPAACGNAWIRIVITDVNLPPTLGDINGDPPCCGGFVPPQPVTEDDTLQLCFNWVDHDGDIPSFAGTAWPPLSGTVIGWTDNDSCLQYVPDPNFNGNDTIAIIVCDNASPAACDTFYIPISVQYENDPPFFDYAGSDPLPTPGPQIDTAFFTVPEDSALRICWNAVDPEGEGGSLQGFSTSGSTTAQAVVDALTGCIWFVPQPNFNGTDTLELVYCDNGTPSLCDTLVCIIDVLPVNDPPQALDDAASLNSPDTVFIPVLGNDFDLEDSVFTIQLTSFPSYGTAVVIGQQIRYISNSGITTAIDSFKYRICDLGMPVLCDEATVVIGIPSGPHPPLAQPDYYLMQEDQSRWMNVLTNDLDVNQDSLDISWIELPSHGAALLVGNQIHYTPYPDYFGTDTMRYAVCDNSPGGGLCDTAFIYITILPSPDPPVVLHPVTGNPTASVPVTVSEDVPTQICLNLFDPDNDPLDVTGNLHPLGLATLSGLSDGDSCFTYTGPPNFSGTDSLIIVVCDNGFPAKCDTVLVLLNILPVNDAPVAVNDTAVTTEDLSVSVNVASNDSDPVDNGTVNLSSVTVVSGPWNGTASGAPGGQVIYNPAPGFSGQDSLLYQICDNGNPLPGQCATAWVFITVDPKNKKPIAVNDSYSVYNDLGGTFTPLANDSDPDGNNLSITLLTPPQSGTATLTGTSINYSPVTSYCGPDSMSYQICDDGVPSLCDTAWILVDVLPADTDGDGLSNTFETLTVNTDNDLKNDFEDLDSDNDGISDEVEAQRLGTDCSPSVIDFDGDGTPDHLDPDSDNDGIADWIERSPTIRAPMNRDQDADGVDDAYDSDYGGYLEPYPIDTDGDGYPDYHDIDSDDDGIPDWAEGHGSGVPPSGNDSDGDGIDDAYEIGLGGGGIHNMPPDTDGDGIHDFRELDSDGDGIPDSDEGGNGNGSVDDDCNDNEIPDWRDEEPCDIEIPQGISPNGDGRNDTWVIDQLFRYPDNEVTIFNRWGHEVYKASPYNNDWAGESQSGGPLGNKEALPAGTYYYILKLGTGLPTMNGYIYLKR